MVYMYPRSPKEPSKKIWVTSELFETECHALGLKQEEIDSLSLWPNADGWARVPIDTFI